MVKNRVLHILLLFFLSGSCVLGQNQNKLDLFKKFAADRAMVENLNYQQAIQLAAKKKWPLVFHTKSGGLVQLVGIDANGKPKYKTTHDNIIAAATTGANQLWAGGSSGLNLSGSSSALTGKLGIWDGGSVLSTHVELTGRIKQKDANIAAPLDHSTHVAGTMIAAGVNPIAKGMSFGAQELIAYTYTNDVSTMAVEAPNLLLSNHSYGYLAGWYYDGTNWTWEGDIRVSKTQDYGFGYYDSTAYHYDYIASNAPNYLICMSAGNQRNSNGPAVGASYQYYDSSYNLVTGTRPAGISNNDSYGSIAYTQNAKNILTVGAVSGLPQGYSNSSGVVMSSFSGWGPTSDGRIKPDIVADGVNVTSCVASSNTAYAALSGTSMSSPNATGSLYLLQEYYNKLHSSFLTSSALKAIAIQTADEAGAYPGPDYQFGWGLLDVLKGANLITSSYNHVSDTIIQSSLTQEGSFVSTYSFTAVASGKGPVKATVSWIDAPGTVFKAGTAAALNNTEPELVYDLDLRITNGTTVYKPWVLNPVIPAAAATKSDNVLDNVEKVEADTTIPGQTYTFTVTTKNKTLPANGLNFSLVISGIGGTAYCTSAATSTSGTRIDSVNFAGIVNKNTQTCTSYSNYTNQTGQIQPNQSLPFSVKVNSCDASNAKKVVKIYIDYNNNGVFTDPGELVATSPVMSGAGIFSGTINTPFGLTANNFTLMRIVAEETTDTSAVKPCGSYSNGETQDYSIQFVTPSNDLALSAIVAPITGACSSNNQFLVVGIKNNGSINQVNVPLTATIKNGNSTIATLTANCADTIAAGGLVNYTFQKPLSLTAGTTYTVSVNVNLTGDQDTTNNTLTQNIVIAAKPSLSAGAEICGTETLLQVNNPVSSSKYLWYNAASAASSVAYGSNTSTTVTAPNNTFYVQSGVSTSIGPVNKSILGAGSYNAFSGNYVNIKNSIPVNLEFVKLYTANAGKIVFTLADGLTLNSDGSYSYLPVAVSTVDVYATNPAPASGAVPDNPADSGAYFYLNLPINTTGNHSLIVQCTDGANIYRNNGVTGSPYPFTVPNVFSITGNSATLSGNANYYQGFYYFFYDLKLSSADCLSDILPVVAISSSAAPTITVVGDSLQSSVANTYQWYLDSIAISNATTRSIKPVQSGHYYVTATDTYGCSKNSANYTYVVTAVQNANANDPGIDISPNPSKGNINVRFYLSDKADISLVLVNSAGQPCLEKTYNGFSGQFNEQFRIPQPVSGIYVLKVIAGNNLYIRKLIVIE